MLLHLDYYVTETSGHNSEYVAWFRKRKDLIEKYCTHGTGGNPGLHAHVLNGRIKRAETWRTEIQSWLDQDTVDISRGNEYAASIFNAILGDGTAFEFNGNVRNFGLIPNLPDGCCVEVPVIASPAGFRKIYVGSLPSHLAILNNINARCEELVVEGSLAGDKRKVFHAVCMDPLTSAVLSLEETKAMVDEMFAANEKWLPQFSH